MCVGMSTIHLQLSPLYLLSTLYVTHVMNYSRPSTAFPYSKQHKAWRGLGTWLGLSHPYQNMYKIDDVTLGCSEGLLGQFFRYIRECSLRLDGSCFIYGRNPELPRHPSTVWAYKNKGWQVRVWIGHNKLCQTCEIDTRLNNSCKVYKKDGRTQGCVT